MYILAKVAVVLLISLLVMVQGGLPGPQVIATQGAVWPRPQQQNISSENYFVLRPKKFTFAKLNGTETCGLLESAFTRYYEVLQQDAKMTRKKLKKIALGDGFLGYLDELKINLTGKCIDAEYPTLDMDESYKLWVTNERVELQAVTLWGILRGLETFSQLVHLDNQESFLRINSSTIKDFPRYKHRGLLIDSSRHFLTLEKILRTLDAMVYNKMNALHWHIVDDQSFPFVSVKFPELSQKGAYHPYTKVYSPEDVKYIIKYARVRGIRVLPEFDTPGHTASWGQSHPELLTPCEIFATYGPMDPSKDTTFTFLQEFFTEIRGVFKDNFIHLGGDEVDFSCWQQSDNITSFMKTHSIATYEALESYYIQKVMDLVEKLQYNSIVWQEVFSNGAKLPENTLVHVWKRVDWKDTLKNVTASGKQALFSACWYLDTLNSGGDWEDFYYCDPSEFDGTAQEEELILGGEACMWGEVVNDYNLISRVWPRASAVAEKLWSPYSDSYDLDEPRKRLEEHTCRMNRRGVEAEPPNGPGFCN
ncbi:hypothetical protein ABEB36_006411 [Hypothenemus hampei]|uniref:Beta-hexosaminidase n=1 Tax=Hypothenemus hampei TaxID=57062 RepID=A0ABD1EQW5_HYPHA